MFTVTPNGANSRAVLKASAGQGRQAFQDMGRVSSLVLNAVTAGSPWVKSLQADVAGRMSKALQGRDRYERWGKHYLRAITRAHELQLCTNFMDGGLQAYGGRLFRDLRARGNQIFVSLPPPQATGRAAVVHQAAGQYVPQAAPVARAAAAAPSSSGMDRYMDCGGG